MKIKEFITGSLNTQIPRDQYIKQYVTYKSYVPYAEKAAACQTLADNTGYRREYDSEGREVSRKLHTDSPMRYLFYRLTLLRLYTDLEIDLSEGLEIFDMLEENGWTDDLLARIPEKERAAMKALLDMAEEDFKANVYSAPAYLGSQVERFATLFGALAAPGLEALSKSLENLDEAKISKITSAMMKFVK